MSSSVETSPGHSHGAEPPPGLSGHLQMKSFGKLRKAQILSILQETGCKIEWLKPPNNSGEMLTICGPKHMIQAAFELVVDKHSDNKKKFTAESQATDDRESAWSSKSPMPSGLPSPPQTLSAYLPAWQMPWPPGLEDHWYHMEPWSYWYHIYVLEQKLQIMRFEMMHQVAHRDRATGEPLNWNRA